MGLPWRLALKAIPWATILANAPALARSAGILLSDIKAEQPSAGAPAGFQDLTLRVEALEARDREVAILLTQMTTQLSALTTATEVLEARVRWLLVLAAVTTGLAAAALAIAFWS